MAQAKAKTNDSKDAAPKLGRNSKNIVKFPKSFKLQFGAIDDKATRDTYKRIMLEAIRSTSQK